MSQITKLQWPLVQVNWIDSCGHLRGWTPIEQLKELIAGECVSVGYLICQDKERIVIAPHIGPSKEDEEFEGDGVFVIPQVAIKKIIILAPSNFSPLEDSQ